MSTTILATLRARLYNSTLGAFHDGLIAKSSSIRSSGSGSGRDTGGNATNGAAGISTAGTVAGTAAFEVISHTAMQSTLFPMMAGVVDETEVPGMGLKLVAFLKSTGMKCSCMGGFWLLRGLYKVGRTTQVYTAHDHTLRT